MVGIKDSDLNVVPTSFANRERNSEMAGRCKEKKSSTSIESLPYEFLFDILVHLSAEDIYNGAMLVSRKWYSMIRSHDFIHAHLQHSTPGLLAQKFDNKHSSFVAIRQGRIEVSKFSYRIIANERWDSCNGLILEYCFSERPLQIHITNPAIKQTLEIIPFSRREENHHWWTIAYSDASKEYKVVHTYDRLVNGRDLRCDILTVGVDKSWRHVCTQHLSPPSKNLLLRQTVLTMNPIVTKGFIHCVDVYHNHVLTLNVETQTVTENPIPQGLEEKSKLYFSMGKSLSMFVGCSRHCLEGWEMKSETGEWTKMYKIDLNAHKCRLEELYGKKDISELGPLGWLKYQKVVFTLLAMFVHMKSTRLSWILVLVFICIKSIEIAW